MGPIRRLELWSGLAPAGGVRLCPDVRWSKLSVTQREDGNDSLQTGFSMGREVANMVDLGTVFRFIEEDGTSSGKITEWPVQDFSQQFRDMYCEVTCGAMRSVFSNNLFMNTITDSPSVHLAFLISQSGAAWLTAGTIQPSTGLTVSYNDTTKVTAGFVLLASSITSTITPGDPPCIVRFNRVSDSAYTVDLLNTPTAGTAHFLENKNLILLNRRIATADPTAPIETRTLTVIDRYRNDRLTYTRDNIIPYQSCRIEVPSRTLDVSDRIVEVVTDYSTGFSTQVRTGAPLRRLSNTVQSTKSTATAALEAVSSVATLVDSVASAAGVSGSVTTELANATNLINELGRRTDNLSAGLL